ncbi:MAG: UvrD-helicase domain-containing protein [Bacteroidales bacterium]|nr:UvrD-helicase domain-containing protein [Bacteroidales bacterium]
MKILKASAGSGKTHALSNTYIRLLLDSEDRYAYRHILAVTFTNKATAEMKARILRDLKELSATDGKARRILSDILHDYSAFAVSTIDKFFQQTLKAFSREIGQFSSYQVELDRESLIRESMDRILDGLTEDQSELIDWLRRSVMDKVEQGQRFSIDEGLFEIGIRLKSEEHRELQEKYGIDDAEAYSKEHLGAVRDKCRKVVENFEGEARSAGLEFEVGEKIKKPGVRAMKANPQLEALFGEPYVWYCTAFTIEKLIFSLGLAGEFYKRFDELLIEKNVMPLDDSNTILRDIIDGSDAPFIYEKIGVRFDHYLLDEFQDTSRIQWGNFLPLLKESESHTQADDRDKVSNLIVGDVKQSIYRWRDSDWRLLGTEVEREFPDAFTEVMEYNWRSTAEVVDFNNRFFSFAAKAINTGIYDDVCQKVKTKDSQRGHVRVTFSEDQMQSIVDSINDARNAHAMWSDIAVLVRGRHEGSEIAERLIAEGWPVISDDSLSLKSSLTVRRLVSLLNHIDNPDNTAGSYLARELGIETPVIHHSLLDLCESLLRSLKADEGETLFVQAFMDELRNWVDINGNNIHSFLKYWNDVNPCIGSPENADSIRILTIHKSKGLEFPYVIFPFADKVGLFKDDVHWARLDASGTALSDTVNGIYPVLLSSSSEQTLFADAFHEEKGMQAIDNINVFYVALTRAEKTLHVISKIPSKKFRDALDKGRQEYVNFSEMLYEFCTKSTDCHFGEEYDFSRMERKPAGDVRDFPATYPSYEVQDRISASEDAFDFFGENGVTGKEASARLCGIELHKALESVRTVDDLDKNMDGESYNLLKSRIEAHPEWFTARTVRNELAIIDRYGNEQRPDRVVLDEDGTVTIIDYKFGERQESYQRQIGRYMSLYRQMGHEKVRGFLWYVMDDIVEEHLWTA